MLEEKINLTKVSLQEITEKTLRSVLRLNVSESQKKFVAPNAVSIAQAYYSKTAWFRAIAYGDTFVGFVMVDINIEENDYFLWRYMIDENYQGKGIGRKALELVVDYIKTFDTNKFYTSSVPGQGSPSAFYKKFGFTPTGEVDEGEDVYVLDLN